MSRTVDLPGFPAKFLGSIPESFSTGISENFLLFRFSLLVLDGPCRYSTKFLLDILCKLLGIPRKLLGIP